MKSNRLLGGTYCLHLQGRRVSQQRNQKEAGKKQKTVMRLRGVIPHKIKRFSVAATKAWNPPATTSHVTCKGHVCWNIRLAYIGQIGSVRNAWCVFGRSKAGISAATDCPQVSWFSKSIQANDTKTSNRPRPLLSVLRPVHYSHLFNGI
jgi:hypothetical protein